MKKIVLNNREGLAMCQLPHTKSASVGLDVGRVVQLAPGANLVPEADLEVLMRNQGFARQFETLIPRSPAPEQNPEKVGKPVLEMLQADGKDIVVADERPLAALRPDHARVLIKETLVPGMLTSWLEEETRPEVAQALKAQLVAIDADPTIAAAGR